MTGTQGIRPDHRIIYERIAPGSRVLDLGCGKGDLLYLLVRDKHVQAQGIELNEKAIQECVRKGLSVFQDNIESSLREYPDDSFDFVILNQSMQEVKKVDCVIEEALRVGARVIVGFPNFAYIRSRLMLLLRGRAPITESLPHCWYDTPNVRFLSITDFTDFCEGKGLLIEESHFIGKNKNVRFRPNLLAMNAVFVVTRG